MAKVTNLKRLIVEDFNADDQELVGRLAFSYNPLIEEIQRAFNKGIDFDNLNQQFIIVEVTVAADGTPVIPLEIKFDLATRLKGIQIIDAENLTDNAFLTGAPFITRTTTAKTIKIQHITGLVPGKKYRLSMVLIG